MTTGYCASCRGQLHIKNKTPMQDYSLICNCEGYTLAVVCDGLGSKKFSQHASKRVSKLIKKEIKKAYKNKSLDPVKLISECQERFIKKLWPYKLKNCDTTCLFVVVSQKSILCAQIGDGLIAVKDDVVHKVEIAEKDFSNETVSFGKSNPKDWKIKVIKKDKDKEYKILLCTDGISDDIDGEDLGSFIDQLCIDIRKAKRPNGMLLNLLLNWPNKHSTDDKSIAVVM